MTQNRHMFLALAVALPAALATAGPVWSQTKGKDDKSSPATAASSRVAPIIAVVDYDAVARGSKAMKGVQAEVLKTRKRYQKEFQDERKAIEVAARSLEKQRPLIKGSDFDKRRRDIEIRALNLRRQTQQRTVLLRRAFSKASLQFRTATVAVVRELSVEKGYNIVLARAMVLHSTPQFNITSQVVERINKQLPAIKFEIPGVKKGVTPKPSRSQRKPAKKPVPKN